MSVETVTAPLVRREPRGRGVRTERRPAVEARVDSVTSAGVAVDVLAGPPASAAPTGAAVSRARIGVIVSSARPEPGTAGKSWWRRVGSRLNSRAVRTHFGTVAGVVILGVLLWRLGTGVFLDGLRRIDVPTLLVALVIGLVTTVLSAWRWALVARGLRIRLPLGAAVADYYRALFLNAALPGGVLGDVHRAVRHGQSAGDMGRGVRSVVLERVAGQVALAVIGGAVLLTMPSPVLAETRHFTPLVALASVGALAVVLALRMNRAPSRRGRALRSTLAEAREGLLSRRNAPGVVVSSVLVLAGHLAMFVLAARVAGSAASVAALLPLAVLALVAMGLPVNVGGFGPREGVAAWAFGAAGLGASSGVAVAVVYGVLSFVAALPGVVVLVARWYTGLRAGSGPTAEPAPEPAGGDYPRALPVSSVASVSSVSRSESSAEVSSEKYAPKESAKLARSSFPFSAEPSEGRPMTPESV
ncbi:flippase-like domain-containing protein [Streptomyces sp. NBC_01613]|uniref:lysylphosphatidylglycerol synthase transmembrane domain-containing protein n=1 Tax=Streptomyces sp. NBC_01613 TaxID=2975896 RepID=UPI00386B85B4